MGSDSSDEFGQATTAGNNFSISINTGSQEEADKLFNGLSGGGKVTMPTNWRCILNCPNGQIY